MNIAVRSFAFTLVSLTLLSSLAVAQPSRNRAAGRLGEKASSPAEMSTGQAAIQTNNAQTGQRMAGRRGTVEKPTGANLSAQQQQNLQKLQTDLQAIKQGSTVTEAQITALKNDLLAMADGATKPDAALVQKLAADVAAAVADGKLSNAEKAKLAQDLDAVMDSANIPEAEVQQAISDAQAILTASGITKTEVQTVVKDLQAIAAEAKKNAQSAGTTARGRLQGLKKP